MRVGPCSCVQDGSPLDRAGCLGRGWRAYGLCPGSDWFAYADRLTLGCRMGALGLHHRMARFRWLRSWRTALSADPRCACAAARVRLRPIARRTSTCRLRSSRRSATRRSTGACSRARSLAPRQRWTCRPAGRTPGGLSLDQRHASAQHAARAEDFDGWAALGNAGWSYAEVLPYFQRLEASEVGDPRAARQG